MSLAFWLIFLLAWILDLLGGQGILLSLFGSLLWGLALGATLVGDSSKDSSFSKKCYLVAGALSSCWLLYWFCGFFYPAATTSTLEQPFWIKIFIVFHAGLLSSAVGLVFILALTSLGWILSEFWLRKSSWERRSSFKFKIPSLESLSRGARGSLHLAFRFWGMGLFLAAVTTYLQAKNLAGSANEALYTWRWLSDVRVLFTATLWVLLYLGINIERIFRSQKRWCYRSYFLFSLFFITLFVTFMSLKGSFIHEPVVWFLR